MDRLPIHELAADLVAAVRRDGRVVVQAPTGSGKSTQVPQLLLDEGVLGAGQVVVLQPRRLAARLLAARVAHERGVAVGGEVGYQIRFENVTSPSTRIRYVTEGVLLRQMLSDPALGGVTALIFDEFHERHLYGDITLAQALDLQDRRRPDLRLLVMSATLEVAGLEAYLKPCRVLRSEGRVFPVDIEFARHRQGLQGPPVWELAAEAFAGWRRRGGEGDVLVFMPGGFEIQRTLEAFRQCGEAGGYTLLPLHGELPPDAQDAAVARYDRPKVVVATNVAETSITIDGIRLVIDSGLARIPRYDPYRGINTLLVEKISQASAVQRSGRAGRTAPGHCIRLWSESEHDERPVQELPEVRRLDLSEVVLSLKAAGVGDLGTFRWLEAPAPAALARALELLADLGALDATEAITALGRAMLAFPVHPRYARMLLAAQDLGCVRQAALIAALTQGRDLLIRNPGREVQQFREDLFGEQAGSDFWILMRAWSYASKQGFRMEACRRAGIHAQTARQVGPLLDQFLEIARREGLDIAPRSVPDEALQRCILIGFSDRVARRLDAGTLRCELVHGRRGMLARESAVHGSPLLVAAEVREIGSGDGSVNTLLSLATAIEPAWLEGLYPEDLRREVRVSYDSTARRVMAEERVAFRGLALSTRRVEPPPAEAAARLLAEEVVAGRVVLGNWDHAVEQWILRLNALARWCPELGLPPITEADRRHLIEQVCQGAVSARELKELAVGGVVRSWVSSAQQEQLDRHAPERLPLSNGRQPKLVYEGDGPPHLALRIQELFGVTRVPPIAMGRVAVTVRILAPNMRPVQITQDLAGFWRDQYPRVKQELQRRYPKHEWR